MDLRSAAKEGKSPEMAVDQLCYRLKRHALWDLLLIGAPLFLVLFYVAFYLNRIAWIKEGLLISIAAALIAAGLLFGVRRFFSSIPTPSLAARSLDEQANAKERFLTLATLPPASTPSSLFAQLRQEAAALLERIDFARDFPYRAKRSFAASLIASLALLLLFHLFLLVADLRSPRTSPAQELAAIAQQLAAVPQLSTLAQKLKALAEELQKDRLSEAEKQALAQELLKQVEKQHERDSQDASDSNNLLSQAGNALRKMEQGEGENQEQKGGGGIKTNLPDEKEGSGTKQSQGSGGEGEQRDASLSQSSDLKEGNSAQNETDKSGSAQGKGKGQERDNKLKDEKQKNQEPGTAKSEQEGKGEQHKYQEGEIPQGAVPSERLAKPGEQGGGGVKGARFVTVELPEVEASGASGGTRSGKRKSVQPKLPVSNVPLRQADVPEAAAEKQPLPLEYRGLIR